VAHVTLGDSVVSNNGLNIWSHDGRITLNQKVELCCQEDGPVTLLHRNDPTNRIGSQLRRALEALGRGEAVMLTDESAGVGLLVFAGQLATAATVAFVVRHSTGFVRVAMPRERCTSLGLPPQLARPEGVAENQCLTVDAVDGVSTGISAADRARTIRLLSDAATQPEDLARPGHVVPVRVPPPGSHEPRGIAALALDLVELAGLGEQAAYAELVSVRDCRDLAGPGEAVEFAKWHRLAVVDGAAVLGTQPVLAAIA
jgi:3,4-dihydroxy 2-butanone 4-phosphate synthase/GTP cyclohydrolase II